MHGVVTVLGEERGRRETCAARTEFLPVRVSVFSGMTAGERKKGEGAERVILGVMAAFQFVCIGSSETTISSTFFHEKPLTLLSSIHLSQS